MTYPSMDDVRGRKKAHDGRVEPNRSIVNGTIVERDGSINDPNNPNRVWVAEWNDRTIPPVSALKGEGITHAAGVHVKLAKSPKDPYARRIIGIYDGGLVPGVPNPVSVYSSGPHAQSHQIPSEAAPGDDPVHIYQPAWMPLKTTADGTLVVRTEEYIYVHQGQRRVSPLQTTDLTSYRPGAGLIRRVLLYLDRNSNTLQVALGTAVINNGAIPIPYPDVPEGGQASAYIKLANAQTAISQVTHVEDSRGDHDQDFLSATQIGQVPFSLDGITFTAQLPLTNEFGWMVNDDGILIVI